MILEKLNFVENVLKDCVNINLDKEEIEKK